MNAVNAGFGCAAAVVIASLVACGSSSPSPAPVNADREVAIAVTAKGFEPKQLVATVGKPVTLIVTRKVERTCATEIVIKDYAIDQPLPLDQSVKIVFTPTRPGPVRFACAMDMIAGEILVR